MASTNYAPTSDLSTARQSSGGLTATLSASDGWVAQPLAWDTIRIAGQAVPGLAQVDAEREYQTDHKRVAGADGHTLTGFGHMPAKAKITLRIWTDEQLNRLDQLMPTLFPPPRRGRPQPVDVQHPALKRLYVRSLYFTKIGSLKSSRGGVYEMQLEAVEFLPVNATAPSVTSTPKGSAADPNSVAVENGLATAGTSGVDTTLGPVQLSPLDALIQQGIIPTRPQDDPEEIGP